MAACGSVDGGSESRETQSADVQTETAVESETEEADPFADFNYDGKDFRIYTSTNIAAVSLGNSFALAYNTSLNEILTSGIYNSDNIAAKKNDSASSYAKREKVALQKLEKIITDFEAMQEKQQ